MGGADREGGGVEDHRGRRGDEEADEGRRRDRVFQRGDEYRQRVEPALDQRLGEPDHRVEPGAFDQRPVEDEGHDRRALGPMRAGGIEIADPRARPVDACAQERAGGCGALGAIEQRAGMGEEPHGVLRPALDEIGPERVVIFVGHGREAAQLRVGLVVAGQERQRHTGGVQVGGVLLGAVAPVADAAEHPGDDEPGVPRAALDMKVDRHRVGEMGEVGEPQRGRGLHLGAGG